MSAWHPLTIFCVWSAQNTHTHTHLYTQPYTPNKCACTLRLLFNTEQLQQTPSRQEGNVSPVSLCCAPQPLQTWNTVRHTLKWTTYPTTDVPCGGSDAQGPSPDPLLPEILNSFWTRLALYFWTVNSTNSTEVLQCTTGAAKCLGEEPRACRAFSAL